MVLTPDELRRVAEEVRVAFPRPLRAPQLVLIDVDPRHLHAFWTLDAAAVEDARRQMDDHGRDAAMVLRTMEIGDDGAAETAFDVEVIGLQGQCYVDIWGDAREYRSELGLRRVDGGLWSLAGPAHVELPRLGPANEATSRAPVVDDTSPPPFVPPPPPSPVAEASPGLDREPVIHPFPQPPSAPGAYDPLALPETPSQAAATGEGAPQTSPFAAAAVAPPPTAAPEPPEPVRYSFPSPPTDPGEFVPGGQSGDFPPGDVPVPPEAQVPPAELAANDAPHDDAPRDGEAGAPEPNNEPAGDHPEALPLENVLTLSSFALGREAVEFEINAELHIFGRARPGTRLQLFGRPVTLRPDGSFSITRPLPNGALVLSSLLISDDGDPSP